VIVLFDAGTKQLLGKPIGNYLDQPDEALDTAVKCVEDDQLPDEILKPITNEMDTSD